MGQRVAEPLTEPSRLPIRAAALPTTIDDPGAVYMRPTGIVQGVAALGARPFGPNRAFTAIEVLVRGRDAILATVASVDAVEAWAVRVDVLPRFARVAGCGQLLQARPRVMGVINVTPDSFSDGGDCADADTAIRHGLALAEAGADILDVGGESTRPGAAPVEAAVEIARAVPVVRALARQGAVVSIDTRNAATMRAALDAGAAMINDVSALAHDPAALGTVAKSACPVVLMHSLGDPRTMQDRPAYDCAPLDVFDALEQRIVACGNAGIARDRIIVDPGIGFGKTVAHNLEILARLGVLHGLGCPILLGASRKSFIARLSRGEAPKERGPGSLAVALHGLAEGAAILRVHDVAETVQALRLATAVGEVG